ncbi:MAG: energy transducer TonB [Capnocytophaga sp.]|nr:energy transducer TonB [Capnocytophaga sp.]
MNVINTPHKRKSLVITAVLMSLLVLLLFYVGLKYMDPPPENGIAITFGVDNVGMGERTPPPRQSATKPTPPQPETTPQQSASQANEKVVTQDTEESVVIPKETQKVEKKKEETPKKETKTTETPKEKPKEEPKPSKEATDALSNILGAANAGGSGSAGQGDDNKAGYKGDPKGDPYASSYHGSDGSGSGGRGWGLNGRSLVSGEVVKQECNESGKVVVRIEVDQSGKVVKATPGVRGTTNNAPCLLEPARQTALRHRWNTDTNAPARQIGFIEINFRLGE